MSPISISYMDSLEQLFAIYNMEEKMPLEKVLIPKRIIYNGKATIVYWGDNSRTVVKCSENENFSKDMGFLAALGKKVYKERSKYLKFIEKAYIQEDKIDESNTYTSLFRKNPFKKENFE